METTVVSAGIATSAAVPTIERGVRVAGERVSLGLMTVPLRLVLGL